MTKNKKSKDSANLCSMSFLKVLKSRIKKADRKSVKTRSEAKFRGLDAFNSNFQALTS